MYLLPPLALFLTIFDLSTCAYKFMTSWLTFVEINWLIRWQPEGTNLFWLPTDSGNFASFSVS